MLNCGRGARQKGFTLIEMSIVLVIIGLIIGGILKGQEIIESSRQKNLISQFDALRGAVNTFTDRFGSLPGDYALALTRINTDTNFANGDGNGEVGAAQANIAAIFALDASVASSENLQFFIHLHGADLVEGVTALNTAPTAFGSNSALPSVAMPGAGMTVATGEYAHATDTRSGLWARIHRDPASPAPALSPAQAYTIDSKIDDGVSGMGTFRTDQAADCGTADAVTQDYEFTQDNVLCMAAVYVIN